MTNEPLISPHGGYRKLKSFQVAQLVYDLTQIGHGGLRGQKASENSSTKSTRSTSTYAEIAANAALTLINVAGALLHRQISSQVAAFENQGGFTERLYRVRSRERPVS